MIDYIQKTIRDQSIEMNEKFRSYLMNPKIAVELEGKNAIHWMRLSWLILFSVLHNTMTINGVASMIFRKRIIGLRGLKAYSWIMI